MSIANIPFKLTVAGQDAAFNLGAINLNVTHVQLGSGNRNPNGNEVALVSPQEYSVISGHFEVSIGQHRIAAVVPGSASIYQVSEIGLWSGVPGAGGSVLVFYWALPTSYIAVKSASIDFNFESDIFFGGVVPGNITIVADTQFNALAMLAAHEADPNRHPYYIRHYATAVPLPTTNIGPIWHDDYNSIMTWQVFNANGAAYTGYASVLVGNLLIDTQPTPRAGYIKSGVANLSRTAYAALRGWAKHNGLMVAEGVWAAGNIVVKDNADGTTFTAFDVRGEYPRFWDDGRGIVSQNFGQWLPDQLGQHSHDFAVYPPWTGGVGGAAVGQAAAANVGAGSTNVIGGSETRVRGPAFLATIKF